MAETIDPQLMYLGQITAGAACRVFSQLPRSLGMVHAFACRSASRLPFACGPKFPSAESTETLLANKTSDSHCIGHGLQGSYQWNPLRQRRREQHGQLQNPVQRES